MVDATVSAGAYPIHCRVGCLGQISCCPHHHSPVTTTATPGRWFSFLIEEAGGYDPSRDKLFTWIVWVFRAVIKRQASFSQGLSHNLAGDVSCIGDCIPLSWPWPIRANGIHFVVSTGKRCPAAARPDWSSFACLWLPADAPRVAAVAGHMLQTSHLCQRRLKWAKQACLMPLYEILSFIGRKAGSSVQVG